MAGLVVFAAIFLDLFGFGMVLPEVQLRAEHLGASGPFIGLILTSTFAIQLATSPLWGRLSDRFGRKPVLVATTTLSGLGLLCYGLAPSLLWILFSRSLSGLGGANVATAQAALADLTPEGHRTQAMGRLGAIVSAGLIAGPALGAILAHANPDINLGVIAGISSLLGAALALTLPKASGSAAPQAEAKSRRGDLLRDVSLRPLFLVSVTAWLGLAVLEGTFGRLLEHNLHQGAATFSAIFSYESLLGVAVQALLLGWLSRRIPASPLLRLAFLLEAIGLAATPFAPSLVILILVSTAYAVGAALSNPTLSALASDLAPPNRQGELFGLLQSARSVGFIVGPLLGGLLFDAWPAAPYLTAGAACLAATLLVALLPKPQPQLAT
jgi:MFS family permease